MKHYLLNYKFIVGKYETNCQLIVEVEDDTKYDDLYAWVCEYFENFYGENEEGEPNCDRDGEVCFYNGGEVCIQFFPCTTELPKDIGEWFKNYPYQTITIISLPIDFDKIPF